MDEMKKNLLEQIDCINICKEKNKDLIPLIAKTIKAYKPQNIILIGLDSNYNECLFAKYLIEIYYKVPTSIASPSIFLEYDSEMLLNKTLVIALSSDGKNEDIKNILFKFNNLGALTLSITNDESSPIAIESKYDLYNCTKKHNFNLISNTYASTIYMLIKLVYELTSIPELDIEEERIIENLSESLNYIEQIENNYTFFNDDTIVFSYGYTTAIAEEFSLLNLYLSNKNFNNFNLDNITFENVNLKNKNVLIFAIDKFTYNNIIEYINKLKKNNCKIYTITNKGDINNLCENGIYINEDNDLYAMFTTIGIIQLLSYKIKNS